MAEFNLPDFDSNFLLSFLLSRKSVYKNNYNQSNDE